MCELKYLSKYEDTLLKQKLETFRKIYGEVYCIPFVLSSCFLQMCTFRREINSA